MEGEQETMEPASDDTKEANYRDKEANLGDTEAREGVGEIVKEATTIESPPADSEKEKSVQKIEQRPFFYSVRASYQDEGGEEEEVKRCQDLFFF